MHCLHVALNLGAQRGLIGSHKLVDLFAALVELKGRHGTDLACSSDFLSSIDVDLAEFYVGHLLRHLLKDRTNELARSAPVDEK